MIPNFDNLYDEWIYMKNLLDKPNNYEYILFLDDIRNPGYIFNYEFMLNYEIKCAKTYSEAVNMVQEFGCPNIIFIDHDLGEDKTGMDFAKWLVEYDMDNNIINPDNFNFEVHSANLVGKENIEGLLKNYLKMKDENS